MFSIEVFVDDKIENLLKILEELKKVTVNDAKDFLNQIEENKKSLSAIDNSNIARTFIDLTAKNLNIFLNISTLSNEYINSVFTVRIESDDVYGETKIKRGDIIECKEFSNLINWRIYCQDMYLKREDIINYILGDLEYLFDECGDFIDFKEKVLEQFEDVEFTSKYTKDDLIEDIGMAYELYDTI